MDNQIVLSATSNRLSSDEANDGFK